MNKLTKNASKPKPAILCSKPPPPNLRNVFKGKASSNSSTNISLEHKLKTGLGKLAAPLRSLKLSSNLAKFVASTERFNCDLIKLPKTLTSSGNESHLNPGNNDKREAPAYKIDKSLSISSGM